jgi:hypothetical protein
MTRGGSAIGDSDRSNGWRIQPNPSLAGKVKAEKEPATLIIAGFSFLARYSSGGF